jgi:hypothetical protein
MPMSPRLLRPRATGFTPTDADARTYVAAVRTADGQPLENAVAKAIDTFVLGCKADGTWTALSDCCLLAGPRTIAGCCVALKGTAPTSNAFGAADYNRETGMKGSTANTKYLDTNVNHNTFAQNDFHMSVWVTEPMLLSSSQRYIGAGSNASGASTIFGNSGALQMSNQCSAAQSPGSSTDQTTGLIGTTRSLSNTFTMRWGANSGGAGTRNSQTPHTGNVHVFRDASIGSLFTEARLAWYSLGSNIDFSLLRTRLTTYLSDIAAAIQ